MLLNKCKRCPKKFGMWRAHLWEWSWSWPFVTLSQFCSEWCKQHYHDERRVERAAKRYLAFLSLPDS